MKSIVFRHVDELVPYARNARTHSAEQVARIAGSIAEFGFAAPVLADDRGIVAGHGRVLAARRLYESGKTLRLPGGEEIPSGTVPVVDVTGWSDAQRRAYILADNRLAEQAGWDEELLRIELQELRDSGFDLELTGFELGDLDALLSSGEPKGGLTDPDEAPEPEKEAVSRLGDMWALGSHRILCGDSTKAEHVARLMGGDTAVLLATDPPYLVDYDGTNHPAEHHRKAGREASPGKDLGNKHWDAYVDPDASVDFFTSFLRAALAHCIERVPVYQWHASRRQALVETAWEANGLLVHQTLIWVKSRGVLTRSHYLWKHEPCFYGWPRGKMPEKSRRPATDATSTWNIDQKGTSDGSHPTMKPVEVFERPIAYHTRPGEVVLEPFSGSGTQIIAAERLSRKCRAMELSPVFVDVAVKRWQAFTGEAAVLDGDGRTFEEVAAERRGAVAVRGGGDHGAASIPAD